MEQIKETLKECLVQLAGDMNRDVSTDKAKYIHNRVYELICKSVQDGNLRGTEEMICGKIRTTFNTIYMGQLDCREINVICIMKCLTDRNYGIYPPVLAR